MRRTSAILVLLTMVLLPCSVQAQEADAEVLVAEGIFAYDAKRYDEAISLLSRAVAVNPRKSNDPVAEVLRAHHTVSGIGDVGPRRLRLVSQRTD
ncbi:MAG: tetratricopeptide repeat protein [Nitrospira defluvii]|nr:tetratricopeptide repeat protein [Nitrospira defluvii]